MNIYKELSPFELVKALKELGDMNDMIGPFSENAQKIADMPPRVYYSQLRSLPMDYLKSMELADKALRMNEE